MRLEEIQQNSSQERVDRLSDSAKVAKDKAKQLKAQADASAAQLDVQKSRQQLTNQQRSPAMSMIKPYH
jgi:uncharacterized protein YdaT